ncbi:BPTD_3080 family restriction endonuclease [Actinokineospora sp.]|uniref:BPTD_3080 family restriction endonuclease n=1 Tax=Actinokineospora sp. TaxID=1872133 RepID=UPI003D6BDD4B
MSELIASPILNGPYEPPARHFEVGPHGPTGEVKVGRRPSESFIPIASARKGRKPPQGATQESIDFDLTGERRERNSLINDLRRDVDLWRQRGYNGVTPTSRKLLDHWADPSREDRMLFCQREAAETAIFLAEVAGRHGYRDWRREIDDQNASHNSGLPRVALKMATGSGKTVVMAMLIAWQTLNKVQTPKDARFSKRFLVITPGITIRDRLRVLFPGDGGNYYDARDLIPPDLKGPLHQAQIIVTNYHSFLLKDAKEIKGVSSTTRKLLRGGKKVDNFRETPDAMAARVLRDFGAGKGEVVVFNDEAHHCYQDKPIEGLSKEQKDANEDARVWFKGVQAVARKVGVKAVYDLSATPFYLGGSGYNEGYIFPWTVSDFSLMDAIESGIVKIPRTPIDDDAAGELVTYLNLWAHVGEHLPKRRTAATANLEGWIPPPELEGALNSLYRSYQRAFEPWEKDLREHGETPPVFIVVCPNTVVSKLVYDWIAGVAVTRDDGTVIHKPGKLALFDNSEDGTPLARPRTILVDSAELESGNALKPDFKKDAAGEIAAFKAEYRRRDPGADVDKLTDEDLLREVMNTVGKKGKLGEDVRCVVSVAMLTEGWDANTVTHILGIRAFRSQLLCEQVVGRGLRRRSYAINDDGRFDPEYSNVYGIPFAFIPSDRPTPDLTPKAPAITVCSVEDREGLRIEFPKLDGYRLEIPDEELIFDTSAVRRFQIEPGAVPTWTESAGIVGESEMSTDRDLGAVRDQEVAFALARRLLTAHFNIDRENPRPWLFPALIKICRQWLAECVDTSGGFTTGNLLGFAQWQAHAAEQIHAAITVQQGARRERLRPMLRRFDPVGSTDGVWFLTRKAVTATEKSHVSHVTLDGKDGNTWEQILALECELNADVAAYVKNDHLGFTIPYVHKGRSHAYLPDFLLRLRRLPDEEFDRTLIVEVSGGQKSPGSTQVKADTARHSWCAAVNNHGGFGRWGYVEIRSMVGVRELLAESISNLYADDAVIGDPSLLDFNEVKRGA